ncbi:transposase [Actinomyces sp.]
MGTRRRFTLECRRDVATLVLDSGSSIASVARDLGLGETVAGRWSKSSVRGARLPSRGLPIHVRWKLR